MRASVWLLLGLQPGAGPALAWQASASQEKLGKLTGVLQEGREGREIVLAKVRLMSLRGTELKDLRFSGPLIVDTQERVAIARTDAAGRFAFDAVPPGRYAIALSESDDAKTGPLSFLEYRRARSFIGPGQASEETQTLFFDLADGDSRDLGPLWEPRKR